MENETVIETKVFETLSNIDVSGYIDKKNNLDYLSWATAYKLAKKEFPDLAYNIIFFDGKPYFKDETGYMVFTQVRIKGETIDMWLPVMDYRNQSIKNPSMTDINKSLMRCLTKNLAMFGIGISLYAGEDLPSDSEEPKAVKKAVVKEEPKEEFKCVDCGKDIKEYWSGKKLMSAKNVAELSVQKFGKALCMDCIAALKAKQQGDEYDKSSE